MWARVPVVYLVYHRPRHMVYMAYTDRVTTHMRYTWTYMRPRVVNVQQRPWWMVLELHVEL